MSAQPIGRRERKKQAVREKICSVTLDLIRLHGIEGTTIEDICERTDIAKKTFYNYYPSRHELLIQISQSTMLLRTQLNVEEAMGSSDSLDGQLTFIFNEIRQNMVNADVVEKAMIDYMIVNLSSNRTQSANQLSFMNGCYRVLFENSADQLKPGLDPIFCAELLVGMINATTMNWLNDESYDFVQSVEKLQKFILDSMLKSG